MRLRLLDPTTIQITCPPYTSQSKIVQFLQSNQTWIFKHLTKIPTYPNLLTLQTVSILGQTRSNSFRTKATFIKHYKDMAFDLVATELELLCQKFGFSYQKLSLRNQVSRFGSCSHSNNLSINWQSIFLPLSIFRHLLLHELVHTQIKNHGPNFWAKLTECDPDTQKHNTWLKKNGTRCFYIAPN